MEFRKLCTLRILIVTLTICAWANADIFSAVSHIEPLIETHEDIVYRLNRYINKEKKRLDVLGKFLKMYKREHDIAMQDISNYLGNPIHSFTLIKRLSYDLKVIDYILNDFSVYRPDKTLQYPEEIDLNGAAKGLAVLQNTYSLNITELANGILKGNFSQNNEEFREIVAPLTASDCFELGHALIEEKKCKDSIPWLLEAIKGYDVEEDARYTEIDILDHISQAYYGMGDIKRALKWANNNLKVISPEDSRFTKVKEAIEGYKQILYDEETKKCMSKNNYNSKEDKDEKDPSVEFPYKYDGEMYKSLCRGEVVIPSSEVKRLKCYYLTETHPFLKLAPIKAEQLYLKPDILLLHKVLNDREIEHIKNLSQPRLQRANAYDGQTQKYGPVFFRVLKLAWLPNCESDVVTRVTNRVSHFTSWNMETSTDLQVANYGIGGCHMPHFDYSLNKFASYNRMGTVIFYLSDVAQGGATVFLELGVTVFPVRGAALFWRNLHPSGEGDEATAHAGCPVLHGSKWIANFWLHQEGQELLFPCDLEYQKAGILRKIPRPEPKYKMHVPRALRNRQKATKLNLGLWGAKY